MSKIKEALVELLTSKCNKCQYYSTGIKSGYPECARCQQEKLKQLIESLYNIVEGEFRTMSMVFDSSEANGYNSCRNNILQKFNDKLGIKGE
jgi:hypothetical protein